MSGIDRKEFKLMNETQMRGWFFVIGSISCIIMILFTFLFFYNYVEENLTIRQDRIIEDKFSRIKAVINEHEVRLDRLENRKEKYVLD